LRHSTDVIILTVLPSLDADGRKCYGERGALFDGSVNNRRIVRGSPTPFCNAARVLLAEGIKPGTTLIIRHEGSPYDALRSTVGAAAKLTVSNTRAGKPVFGDWKPRPRMEVSTSRASPISDEEVVATLAPSSAGRILEATE
jgi:hypothetical protein